MAMQSTTGRWRMVLAVTATAVIVVGSLAAGGYLLWLQTPPDPPGDLGEALEVIESHRFSHLSGYRKEAYLGQTRELYRQADKQQRAAVGKRLATDPGFRKAMRDAMAEQMMLESERFVKAEAFQKQQILDRVIGAQEWFARRVAERRASGEDTQHHRNLSPARKREFHQHVQDYVEHRNPQRQAYVSEFYKALRQRREALGLPADPVMQ